MRKSTVLMLLFAVCQIISYGQVSISSTTTPYTQNFNTLRSTSGTSTSLPTGWRILEAGANANTSYATDAGTSTTGDTYSYGTGTNTERSLGSLQSSSVNSVFGIQIRNTTGRTITSINLSYTGEQWRCGATGRGADRLDFAYSSNATSLSNGTWVNQDAFDFQSPFITTVGARDGNAVGNRQLISGVITGVSIPNNGIIWLRWSDFNITNSDDGLSIDDLSIRFNAADITPPVVSTLIPVNGSSNVILNPSLTINFSEPVQKGTGTITIRNVSNASIVQTIDVTSAAVTVSGSSATIPSSIPYGSSVYIEIAAGSFRDLAGNNFAGISGSSVWRFSIMPPPVVVDTLKVVAWNIEWFGGANGPTDDNLQQQNVQTVLRNINADVYALSEVVSVPRLQSIVSQMPGYSFVVSDFCSNGSNSTSCASAQKLAFVYRTSRVNKIREYGVLRQGGSANASYNWSTGRFPFLMEADVTMNGTTQRIQFVVVHAKANTSDFIVSYNRRKAGADELRDSLNVQYGNSNVIVLGDFNDDLDRTITTQIAPDTTTSWISFKQDVVNFNAVTLPLSIARVPSMASYPDIIDHVVISNDLNRFYVPGSARVLRSEVEGWITNYATTTSDHFPVMTNYVLTVPIASARGARKNTIDWTPTLTSPQTIRVSVKSEESTNAFLQLSDLSGRLLAKQSLALQKGINVVNLNAAVPASGLYLLQINTKSHLDTRKIFISK